MTLRNIIRDVCAVIISISLVVILSVGVSLTVILQSSNKAQEERFDTIITKVDEIVDAIHDGQTEIFIKGIYHFDGFVENSFSNIDFDKTLTIDEIKLINTIYGDKDNNYIKGTIGHASNDPMFGNTAGVKAAQYKLIGINVNNVNIITDIDHINNIH